MVADEAKKKVPVKPGLFTLPENGKEGHLLAGKCKSCGEFFHPKRAICANCYSEDQAEVALGKKGKIATYTIARISYPHTPVPTPFVTAQVKMPENVQVLSLITDIDPENVQIGTEVELYFFKCGDDEQGNELMAYAFKPVGK